MPPDQAIALTLSGLPHHSAVPQWTTLSLAILIIAGGAWTASRSSAVEPTRAAERKRLIARREKLLTDLVRVEHDYRNGRLDSARHASRREELIGALEPVYAALDGPPSLTPETDEPRRARPSRPERDGAPLGSSANA